MRNWDLIRGLDPGDSRPLFVQLAQAIAQDVAEGRLASGARLPGSRTLADTLGVHRNTVLEAYSELAAEGFIETLPKGGTFVAQRLPDAPALPLRANPSRARSRPGYDLREVQLHPQPRYPKGALVLARGAPDPRLLPTAELARAYRRQLLRHGSSLLFYGDPQGHERLRRVLAEMLSQTRRIDARPETVLVTRGSQMAIALAARLLLQRGDAVAVEELGHPLVWSALRETGAKLLPIPLDEGGLSVGALEKLLSRRRLRAVYVTPHHQFPTAVVMPQERRLKLLSLARRHRFVILEDDYDHEFHYGERPILPLASADEAAVVLYFGTLSKILAPGLRLGFVTGPREVIERMVALRVTTDIQGDQATECAVAELFEEGELQRHVHRMRAVYEKRRDALVEALREHLGRAVSFAVPAGGMALWLRAAGNVDVEAWAARALPLGVAFTGARQYDFAGRNLPHARLAFTFLGEAELDEAVRRMAAALKPA
ncbi:MAG TPA: PLP-dependent aminotransferase family protein [Myxococcales bacterium]|nr:PLP-dependent aminotransferase family protein [Myxococcales bacterium]